METSITYQRLVKMHYIYPLIMFAMLLRCSNGQQDAKRYHKSPEWYGLKPANVLDEVPIPDLKEPVNPLYDPTANDLNTTSLLIQLGSNFDSSVMSIGKPSDKDSNKPAFNYRRSHRGRLIPLGTLPEYLQKMDFKQITLANGSKLKTGISPKLKKKIQQFLWAQTACSVIHKWKDLGIRMWPRYLKVGYCPKNISCSIPPGMTCQASAFQYKVLLRWACPGRTKSRYCSWKSFSYPLLTECSCSCPTKSND